MLEPAESLGKVIIALIIGLSTVILGGIGGGFLIAIKMACAVFAAIGPIFVCCLLFKTTKQLFFRWLDQIIGYGIFSLILTIIFIFLLKLCTRYLDAIKDGDNIYIATLVFLLLAIISIFMFVMSKDVAMSISGMASAGIAGTISDKVNNYASRKAGKASRAGLQATARGAGYVAGKITSRAGRKDY